MKTNETNPNDWVMLAQERLDAADSLFVSLGSTWTGIELLQESVERFLKAYLISKGWILLKTHNLTDLLDVAVTYDDSFKQYADVCENLTVQFWAQHYPGSDITDVGDDYVEVREQIAALIDHIKKSL